MAVPPANTQTAFPLLSQVPAGPIRDSLRLIWDQLNTLRGGAVPLTLGTVPYGSMAMVANQTIADATPTIVTWGSLASQQGGVVSITPFPTRLTLPRDTPAKSIWLATAAIRWATSAVGYREVALLLTDSGGTATPAAVTENSFAATNVHQELSYLLLDPVPASYLQVQVTHTAGGPLDVETSQSQFTLVRLF